jgi:hypothetical protein
LENRKRKCAAVQDDLCLDLAAMYEHEESKRQAELETFSAFQNQCYKSSTPKMVLNPMTPFTAITLQLKLSSVLGLWLNYRLPHWQWHHPWDGLVS